MKKFLEEGTGKILNQGQFKEGVCYYQVTESDLVNVWYHNINGVAIWKVFKTLMEAKEWAMK